MVAQGGVVLHSVRTRPSEGKTTKVRFTVTTSMMPLLRLLVLFPREDGEVVGDLIEAPVQCQLQHKVLHMYDKMYYTSIIRECGRLVALSM